MGTEIEKTEDTYSWLSHAELATLFVVCQEDGIDMDELTPDEIRGVLVAEGLLEGGTG